MALHRPYLEPPVSAPPQANACAAVCTIAVVASMSSQCFSLKFDFFGAASDKNSRRKKPRNNNCWGPCCSPLPGPSGGRRLPAQQDVLGPYGAHRRPPQGSLVASQAPGLFTLSTHRVLMPNFSVPDHHSHGLVVQVEDSRPQGPWFNSGYGHFLLPD